MISSKRFQNYRNNSTIGFHQPWCPGKTTGTSAPYTHCTRILGGKVVNGGAGGPPGDGGGPPGVTANLLVVADLLVLVDLLGWQQTS